MLKKYSAYAITAASAAGVTVYVCRHDVINDFVTSQTRRMTDFVKDKFELLRLKIAGSNGIDVPASDGIDTQDDPNLSQGE